MTLFIDDGDVRLHHGDALEQLQGMPDGSVDCIVTSPPYWGLRDYGTGTWEGGDPGCEHSVGGQVPDNKALGAITTGVRPGVDASHCRKCGARRVDQQLGLEPTPELFVERMTTVFREARRVLAAHGTCWVNMGDGYNAYNGNRGLSGSTLEGTDRPEARPKLPSGYGLTAGGLKPKDLVGMPWRLAFALQVPTHHGRP